MKASLKSEIRKLFTVRSTYVLVTLALLVIGLVAYFGTSVVTYDEAVCSSNGELLHSTNDPEYYIEEDSKEPACDGETVVTVITERTLPKEHLLNGMQNAIPTITTLVTIIVVLFMAHEFRYNTISYSLTAINSRSKFLLSKLLVAIGFTVGVSLLAIGVMLSVTFIAIAIKDLKLPAQDFNWLYVVLRYLAYSLANVLIGLGIVILVRNLVAGIAAIFVLPMINQLFAGLLMWREVEPTKFLPFSALERFGRVSGDVIPEQGMVFGATEGQASVVVSGWVTLVWLLVLWIVAWWIFIKRDTN